MEYRRRPRGETILNSSPAYLNGFMAREFWRFVVVQQIVAKAAASAIEYPPMQDPASFNLDAIKAKIAAAIKSREGQKSFGVRMRRYVFWKRCEDD